jgi:predicted RNA polymerase sigma factor
MSAPAAPIESVFRRSNAALVAALTRTLGPARLDLVESVVQEAFLRAVLEWVSRGFP